MADALTQSALKRLVSDYKEIQTSPIAGVSASPLEDNFFEWHCNFEGPEGSSWAGSVFHLILFFPKEYPAKSPSAEFMPASFTPVGGATMPGTKGIKICLSIFSDFANIHKEWANEKGTGWSPSYTVQTVLLNLVSFLNEMSGNTYYAQKMKDNIDISARFTCSDCGHSHSKPFPPLIRLSDLQKKSDKDESENVPSVDIRTSSLNEVLTCYVSKVKFQDAPKDAIFGFGINQSGSSHNPSLTSPCEFMTLESFQSLKATGKVESVLREEILYFLPQYITPSHGAQIKPHFEKAVLEITKSKKFSSGLILNVLPKLLNSTVVTFMNGTKFASERALHGYFSFHRLFLWAIQEYKDLLPQVNQRIKSFIEDPSVRLKKTTPNVGEWLALLTVTNEFTWENASKAYLQENFERNVMWYLREDKSLEGEVPHATRLTKTFALTKVSRDLLAFQVLFLDIARPKGMKLEEVAKRYDDNLGFPTEQMENEMKDAVKRIKQIKDYKDWYETIKVPLASSEELGKTLADSVASAQVKDGYNDKKGGGGNRGGRGGRGRGRGGY